MPPMKKAEQKRKAQQAQDEEEKKSASGSEDTSSSGDDDEFPDVSDAEEEQGGGAAADDEDEDDAEALREINVEFEFFGPEEKDFLGLKALLSNYLNGEQFDSSGMIDAIIAEGDVGSVVKTDADDDPIAVMAVLNLAKYKDAPFMTQVRDFITTNIPKGDASLTVKVAQALSAPGTGLIVNDRLLNSPPKLGPPLMQFLMEAIQEAADEGDADAKYERYLLATRVYVDRSAQGGAGPSSKSDARPQKKQKQQDEAGPSAPTDLIFVRPEDEFLHGHASWAFTFPVEGRPVGKDGLQLHRLVMQVDADKVAAVRQELDRVVGNMAAGGAGAAGAGTSAAGGSGSGKAAAGGEKASAAIKSLTQEDVARMAEEAFAAAAAAGAGKGARGGGRKKKQGKGK